MHRIFLVFFITGIILLSGCSRKKDKTNAPQNDSTIGITNNKSFPHSNNFYFVGSTGENPCIYKFSTKVQKNGTVEKDYSKFWSKKNEKVIKLSYSPDKRTIFFLTANDFEKKAVIPFINGIRLYYFNVDSEKVRFLRKIDNGLQVFTMWGQDKAFRIILNSFDRNSADFVDQQTFIYKSSGEYLKSSSKKFNIAKDGYPQVIEKLGLATSPGSRYSVFAVDSSQTSIYLQFNSDGKVKLVTSTDQALKQADWSPDEKYLVFSTVKRPGKKKAQDDGNSGKTKVYIYSIKQNNIVKILDVDGLKNFFIIGDMLILDKGFLKNSYMEIINYISLKPFYTIRLKDGCGLKSIL